MNTIESIMLTSIFVISRVDCNNGDADTDYYLIAIKIGHNNALSCSPCKSIIHD